MEAPMHALPTADSSLPLGVAPVITHGPLTGEVMPSTVVVWARGNQGGLLQVWVSQEADFGGAWLGASVPVTADSDWGGKAHLTGLTPATRYFFWVRLITGAMESAPRMGTFRTAPPHDQAAGFDFLFSSCLGGQGYGRPPQTGWQIFALMAQCAADFFIFLGDSIYADTACPAPPNVPGAEQICTDLASFRARYRYHLEDPHYAGFLAHTPVFVTWDDHEIVNDFGGPLLQATNPGLFEDGRRAYFDYWPLQGAPDEPYRIYRHVRYGRHADFFLLDTRSYRQAKQAPDEGGRVPPRSMLGATQFAWLLEGLAASTATWKFVVSSVPISYPTGWPRPELSGYDGWADTQGLSGFEPEFLALLELIRGRAVRNLIFLVGDTHWPFAISYDPDHDGQPNFYEFGCGPLSALPLAPVQPDPSFNPTVLYAEGTFQGDLFNFGHVRIAADGSLGFRVQDWQGTTRYALTLDP